MRRYPPSSDRSLTVLSAADRLLIDWAAAEAYPDAATHVFHDRFGAVALSLPGDVVFVPAFHSQETALRLNAGDRSVPVAGLLDPPPYPLEQAVLRIPKSLALFEFYLSKIAAAASPRTRVAAGFMTRHFTPRLLEIAAEYAGAVSQSRAVKKARLLLLHDFRVGAGAQDKSNTLEFGGRHYRQYPGVFSANHIDHATRFLLEHWPEMPVPQTILDVACGNGVIGDQLLIRYPDARLTATDDFVLAVASARLNLPAARSRVVYDHTLARVGDASQDLIVTNPPFHFGHEHNIDVSLFLFAQSRGKLRPGGQFVVVANRHLNYATHLSKWYGRTEVVAESAKFVVYRCHG